MLFYQYFMHRGFSGREDCPNLDVVIKNNYHFIETGFTSDLLDICAYGSSMFK